MVFSRNRTTLNAVSREYPSVHLIFRGSVGKKYAGACVNREGPVQHARPRSLARAFAVHLFIPQTLFNEKQ